MLIGVTWWPTQHALHDLPSRHCMSDAVVMVQVKNKGVWPSAWHMIRFNKFTPGVTMNKLLTIIHLVIVRQKPCQTMLHAKVIDQQKTWIPYLLYKNTYCMWLDGAIFNRNVLRMEMFLVKFNYFDSKKMNYNKANIICIALIDTQISQYLSKGHFKSLQLSNMKIHIGSVYCYNKCSILNAIEICKGYKDPKPINLVTSF